MSTIAELLVADDPAAWRSVGFSVDDDGVCLLGTVRLRITPPVEGEDRDGGIVGWVLAGTPEDVVEVDGVPTTVGSPVAARSAGTTAAAHPNGATSIDHIVLLTSDLDRTIAAVERSLGLPLKRTRDGDAGGRPVRQAFFRMGEVILEVVGPPEPDGRGSPTRFFGIAVNVASLPEAAERLGPDLISAPKPAVQAGRSIATVRSGAGLRVPVALMG